MPVVTGSGSPVLVKVLATGNLFIRRGPDLAFDPISVLPKGMTASPTGRDVLSEWVRIPLPTTPGREGWVSIMSGFTEITGDVRALPEIEPTIWPELASLRNCTYHELLIDPLGVSIPEVFNFPDNEVRVNPGTYSILDVDVDGYPEVLHVEVREGMVVDIVVDGFGEKKKCPPP